MLGKWHRVDLTVDLENAKLTLAIDGVSSLTNKPIPRLLAGDALALISVGASDASEAQSVYFDDVYVQTF